MQLLGNFNRKQTLFTLPVCTGGVYSNYCIEALLRIRLRTEGVPFVERVKYIQANENLDKFWDRREQDIVEMYPPGRYNPKHPRFHGTHPYLKALDMVYLTGVPRLPGMPTVFQDIAVQMSDTYDRVNWIERDRLMRSQNCGPASNKWIYPPDYDY